MTRSNAREIAVHLVFSLHYTDEPAENVVRTRMDEVSRSFIGMDKVTLKLSAKQILTLLKKC